MRYRQDFWVIDCSVKWELDALDEVEYYGVFEPAGGGQRIVAWGVSCPYISWKRMFARSRASSGFERSIAVSMLAKRARDMHVML